MHESKVPVLYVKSFHSTYIFLDTEFGADWADWAGDEAGIKDIFARARAEAPCLLVLEDLDSLITDMNRSFFLNEVDGIEGNDGLLLIGTTNHFDRLDPALSSRPSRFDRK
jgi:transitional endoplasmic reticulum ATPase